MRSIFPSAAVMQRKSALVSGLRAQGFGIGSFESGQPAATDLFLVAEGVVDHPAANSEPFGALMSEFLRGNITTDDLVTELQRHTDEIRNNPDIELYTVE